MDSRKNNRIIIVPKDKKQVPEKKSIPDRIIPTLHRQLTGWAGGTKKTVYIAISVFVLSLITALIWPKKQRSEPQVDESPVKNVLPAPPQTLLEMIEGGDYKKDPNILREDQYFVDLAAWKNAALPYEVEMKIRELIKTNGYEYLSKGCGVNFYYSQVNNTLEFISIEPELGKYAVISLYPYVSIKNFSKKVELITFAKSAVIGEIGSMESNGNRLYNALEENQIPSQIIPFMEKALSWTVALQHLNIGDKFKVVYEVKAIDGKPFEITKLKAIYLDNGEKQLYGFYVEELDTSAFYDERGRSLKKKFLMSPIKYARITSGFNLKRFHPKLHKEMPHYGTDYGAEEGTPVFSVGDGNVTTVSNDKNNGNYVKIRHDKAYETTYLHLQGFAPSLTVGKRVSQGELIGYVGKTGLATGPHVCFRLKKDNIPTDHLKDNAVGQPGNPSFDLEELQVFIKNRDILMAELQQISYR